MDKVRLGKTGLMVSRVALGGIPLQRVSKEEAVAIVREAIGLGINFIDTAHGYTDSEEKIGEAIRGMDRGSLVIASKSPANDKKSFNEHLDLSLKRLGADYIDIYQLHNVNSAARWDAVFASREAASREAAPEGAASEGAAPEGDYAGLEEAVKAGKVRFATVSSHSEPYMQELMKSGKFQVVQFPFNYIDSLAAEGLIPLAKQLDIGFIAMKPMGGGILDSAALSFRYLLQFDSIVPDPGIQSLEEIREIAGIVERKEALTAEDAQEIERLREEFGPSWCHRCEYCQPCSQGIPISSILIYKSQLKRFSPAQAKAGISSVMEKAKDCIECRECVSRCPYHLQIPDLLKEYIADWELMQA